MGHLRACKAVITMAAMRLDRQHAGLDQSGRCALAFCAETFA
jgi:hypothetical protein